MVTASSGAGADLSNVDLDFVLQSLNANFPGGLTVNDLDPNNVPVKKIIAIFYIPALN